MICGQPPFPLSKATADKMRNFSIGLGELFEQEVYAVVAVFREGKSIAPNYERIFHKRDLAIADATNWINASGKGLTLVGMVVMKDGFIASWHVLYRRCEE